MSYLPNITFSPSYILKHSGKLEAIASNFLKIFAMQNALICIFFTKRQKLSKILEDSPIPYSKTDCIFEFSTNFYSSTQF